MTIIIRNAREVDIPAIFDVRISVRENHLSLAQLTEMGITPQAIAEALRAEPCLWVAEHAGEVVGFAMADTETACLFALFVHPAWEGRRIGRRLMHCAETFLFAHHETIWLGTDATTGAANFYTHLGWTRRHQMPSGDTRFEKCRDLRPITSVTDQTKAG